MNYNKFRIPAYCLCSICDSRQPILGDALSDACLKLDKDIPHSSSAISGEDSIVLIPSLREWSCLAGNGHTGLKHQNTMQNLGLISTVQHFWGCIALISIVYKASMLSSLYITHPSQTISSSSLNRNNNAVFHYHCTRIRLPLYGSCQPAREGAYAFSHNNLWSIDIFIHTYAALRRQHWHMHHNCRLLCGLVVYWYHRQQPRLPDWLGERGHHAAEMLAITNDNIRFARKVFVAASTTKY